MQKKDGQTIVWCTGISGSERTTYAREAMQICQSHGRPCQVIDVGELLGEMPSHLRVLPNPTALLDGNEDVLKLHRLGALERVEREIEQAEPGELIIVSTHACFMRKGRLVPGFDMPVIKAKFSAVIDVYATVIHDCHDVWARLQQSSDWKGYLSLVEIALWRDTEVAITKMLADYESKPYYLLARRDPSDALCLICQDPPVPKIYLSYPITAIQETSPELLEKARNLAASLREAGFVVFDPLAIKDVPGTRQRFGVETTMPPEQEAAAAVYLNSQTVSRDLQLIDQADMVVVYYPTDRVSPGVWTEMSHARDRRKPLYLCSFPGAPDSVSPFLGLFYTEAFAAPEQMIPWLTERYVALPQTENA